ncbi:putative magnesium transporter NIPA8 isoform X2 [Sesbania bispinosa]|nr:putative magnesium transporter NIPA8 isoform X2 [Sesbania bispinosa]
MGEWIVGAFINLFGSIAINFGTNLLKSGHNERERHVLGSDGVNGKMTLKPIIYFQSWRIGILFFFLGNCLNFISFGYAAQIAWTFFSICTGFIYFQEYQVFDALRTTMFILGVMCVFIGISLLAPDESKGAETKDSSLDSLVSPAISTEMNRLVVSPEEAQNKETRSFMKGMLIKITDMLAKAKTSCALSLGFGEDTINASSVLVMPMMSSKMTGFRGTGLERARILSMRNSGWSKIPMDEDAGKLLETNPVIPPSP